jgi:hypothetical protein
MSSLRFTATTILALPIIENMVEHLGASASGFNFFEKCDLNILENFEIMHACI